MAESLVWRREKDIRSPPQALLSESLFDEKPWFRNLFDDFRELEKHELPSGVASGCEWTSVCINTPMYLSWLVGQCRALGVAFKRANLKHIAEAARLGSPVGRAADVVVNASGLLASRLGGVADAAVKPARGQIVLLRNELTPMLSVSGTDDEPDELLYVMARAAGGGTIVGGTYQLGRWDATPDANIATRMLTRVVQSHPQLAGASLRDLDVVRHGVGLRPYREGGVRIERDVIDGLSVVHNYGHAGWGYQGSYGCAYRVAELVDQILAEKKEKIT